METETQQIRNILCNLLRDVPEGQQPAPVEIETAVAKIIRLSEGSPATIRCDFD